MPRGSRPRLEHPHEGVFSVELVDERLGAATLRVSGRGAEATVRHEPGGHRFQRVPPNEKRGRVHTSTITVAVLREPLPAEIRIAERDLEISTCRASGKGGCAGSSGPC